MNREISERRVKMLNLMGMGLDSAEVVTTIAKEYGLNRKSVYMDWHRRGHWLKQVAGFDRLENVLYESLYSLNRVSNDAYLLYLKEVDNPNARVGGLRLFVEIKFKIAEIVRELIRDAQLEDALCLAGFTNWRLEVSL